jgi:hypothetical protein
MSRTDKTRPYAIQRNDHLLPGYEDHDHDSGECDFEALEQWQRRYNDSEHAIRGTNIRRYPCKRVLRRDVRNSRFGDDPTRKGAREVFKRHDRQRVRMGCQQARWLDDEFGEMLTDELTKPQPHKRYYPEDQAYSGGTGKVVRAGVRKYYLRKKREQAETKVLTRREAALQYRDEQIWALSLRSAGAYWGIHWLYNGGIYKSYHGLKTKAL